MSLELIVRAYKSKIRPYAKSELEWFRGQPTLVVAVEKAAMATNSKGKRHSHQRRLKKADIEKAKLILLTNLNEIEACKSFDEIFSLLEELVRPIKGIGELYVYDTALRIGGYLNLYPTEVYLHAGARTGARRLGFDGKESPIAVSRFPDVLRELEPREIEDLLCIFKDELAQESEISLDDNKPNCYVPEIQSDSCS